MTHLFFPTCCTSVFSIFCFDSSWKWFYSCWKLSHKGYLILPLGGNFVLLLSRYKGKLLVCVCNLIGKQEWSTEWARSAFWDKVHTHNTVLDVQAGMEDQDRLMQHSLPMGNLSFRPHWFGVSCALKSEGSQPISKSINSAPCWSYLSNLPVGKPPCECWRPWVYNHSPEGWAETPYWRHFGVSASPPNKWEWCRREGKSSTSVVAKATSEHDGHDYS